MTWLQALILGIIEGITEYLPISSTGHLILVQRFLGIGLDDRAKAAADCFAICIQAGAILAVVGVYWPRIKQMLSGLLGKDREGLTLAIHLLVGFLPAAVIGILFNDWIEEQLFELKFIAFALFFGGVAILVADRWLGKDGEKQGRRHSYTLAEMTWKMALMIGLLQCLAMWPGTSRSLATILGGLLVGLRMAAAVEFSFLLGVITLSAATVKKIVWPIDDLTNLSPGENYDQLFGGALLMWNDYGFVSLFVGAASATLAAVLAVKWLVSYLNRRGLSVFGWYRIGLSLVMLIFILTNYHGFGTI